RLGAESEAGGVEGDYGSDDCKAVKGIWPRADRDRAVEIYHLARNVAGSAAAAVAQFAAFVIAPGPNRAIRFQRQTVMLAPGDGHARAEADDVHRHAAARAAAVAQFATAVVAPGPNRAIRFQRKTVPLAPGNGHDHAEAADLDRHAAVR